MTKIRSRREGKDSHVQERLQLGHIGGGGGELRESNENRETENMENE